LFSIRLPASAFEEALAATEAADCTPRPFPSDEQLEAAKAFTDGIEADAAELEKQSALGTDAFASLLAHREPASGGDSAEGSLSSLIKCQRCSKVMFSSVKDHHVTLCKIRQAMAATGAKAGAATGDPYGAPPSDSDWQQPTFNTGINGNGRSKGKKRKHQQSYDNIFFEPPPVAKSRFSRDFSRRGGSLSSQQIPLSIDTSTPGEQYQHETSMQAPLSPMLAAAAGLRQGRSAPSRARRRQLDYLPNQDLKEPLILNRSPVRVAGGRSGGGGGASGSPVPLRLASQNSEELQNRIGNGPAAHLAVPVLSQQQQPQGTRVMPAQQAHQMYQHIQQSRAAQGVGAAVAAMVMPSGLHPHQQQMYLALPSQVQQQFAAQLQYAQQVRQQQQQQAAGRRGPGAPILQSGTGGGGGGGTFIPINGMHQTSNTSSMPSAMYHQFVPSSVGSEFVTVQQQPTVPR